MPPRFVTVSYVKGFCDWMQPECELDERGKQRQKGAQMEKRQRNKRMTKINKQIINMQLFKAATVLNSFLQQMIVTFKRQ